MAALQQKIELIVKENLAGGEVHLETLPNGHVCGDVISSAFEDKDYESRLAQLNKVLKDNLSSEELVNVSTLLTYTPVEWNVKLEDVS